MKFALLSLFTLVLAFEAAAQHRRPDPGYGRPFPGPQHPGRVIVRPSPGPGYGRPVGPRYNPPGNRRVIRTARRPVLTWNTGFGYACGNYGELFLGGRLVHNFSYAPDCYTALNDIRYYGDFCDYSDLYDQSGRLEAQFYYPEECRNALGWYY